MTPRNAITVTADQLEQFALESGKTITMREAHGELRLGRKVFIAPLPLAGVVVPEQRRAGESS